MQSIPPLPNQRLNKKHRRLLPYRFEVLLLRAFLKHPAQLSSPPATSQQLNAKY